LLADIDKIMDPEERNAFKAGRPGLRRFPAGTESISLPAMSVDESAYLKHRSYREFSADAVAPEALSELLGKLRSIQLKDNPKYLYASAGGLYPVQTYVYIKEGRVANISGGAYYHDPEQHRLVRVGDASADVRELYDPLINRPIFDNAAFALYLVAELASIGAMYRERALHYSTLEAGHITQLLEMSAPDLGLGLCQIGGLETDEFTRLLDLKASHLLLHGLLGGGLPTGEAISASAASAGDDDGGRDEGEI
jgi:SagB-type dehydrogenase family enzyme